MQGLRASSAFGCSTGEENSAARALATRFTGSPNAKTRGPPCSGGDPRALPGANDIAGLSRQMSARTVSEATQTSYFLLISEIASSTRVLMTANASSFALRVAAARSVMMESDFATASL